MIVSVINEEFKELYENYSIDEISEYSKQKDKLFGRYRTIAEMLGIILIKRAKEMNMNIRRRIDLLYVLTPSVCSTWNSITHRGVLHKHENSLHH